MCLGGGNRQPAPQQPQIIYQGPSDEDRRRDQEAADERLAAYQTQMEQQQALFQAQLQEQIAAANAETERLTGLFEEEAAARAERQSASEIAAAEQSAAAAGQEAIAGSLAEQSSYTTTTESVGSPVSAETTESVADTKKKKKKSTLKIGSGGAGCSAWHWSQHRNLSYVLASTSYNRRQAVIAHGTERFLLPAPAPRQAPLRQLKARSTEVATATSTAMTLLPGRLLLVALKRTHVAMQSSNVELRKSEGARKQNDSVVKHEARARREREAYQQRIREQEEARRRQLEQQAAAQAAEQQRALAEQQRV